MTLDKLKVAARQAEQREEWRAAIELYRHAIREAEANSEGSDPSLHNRIGDLEHKVGDDSAACEAWEQAAARYAEQGFFNNAVALCGKILRLDPTRIRTYLELARFQARKRVLYDVRQNLAAFLDRMTITGRRDAAHEALAGFGAEFSGWHELQDLLDQMLGREKAAGDVTAPAEEIPIVPARPLTAAGGLVFLDTGSLEVERASDPDAAVAPTGMVEAVELERAAEGEALTGLETSEFQGGSSEAAGAVEGLVDIERTAMEVGRAPRAEGLEVDDFEVPSGEPAMDGLESTSFAPPDEAAGTVERTEGLVFIATDDTDDTASLPGLTDDTPVPSADPDDPIGQRLTAHALLEHGDRAGGIAALGRALEIYQDREDWHPAYQVASELIQAEPSAIHRYQARVEVAARMRDVPRLCEAYTELGDALVREGSSEKAVAVYRRILELDAGHARARAALHGMMPDAPTEQDAEGFVDFGALVRDDQGPRSTRMRTETTAISEDEDETFREALAEFKRALDQNVAVEDHQAHYDLGIAFKEMGLLDEAIGEFQKALRSPEGRLRTSEALGQSFFDQGRPAVAEAVLRSVERGPEDDADKIGVLYWLGRAQEAQGKHAAALACYERVLAVDVAFQDASDRATALAAGPGA